MNRGQRRLRASRGPTLIAMMALAVALGACASTSQTHSNSPGPGATAAAGGHEHGRGAGGHEHGQGPGEGAGKAQGDGEHSDMMGGMCPMKVQGATVSVSDVDGGVALAFTTKTGDVAELRRRVRHMAEMHDRHQEHGMSHHPMVKATATAEDIDGGARMLLRPADPSQLEMLRAEVRNHAEKMERGRCPNDAAQPQEGG